MPDPSSAPTGRADRILDAAGALLLRMGYRKVTVEDIAKQAGIGKGTVYLHWRTKELLFEALVLREAIDLVEELLDGLHRDISEARPHRFMRSSFLATDRRPLMRALFTGDTELLGALKDRPHRTQEMLTSAQFYDLMVRYRLLRDDIPNLAYALEAAVTGFFLLDIVDSEAEQLDSQAKADALAHTVREAFEPAAEPDAAELTAATSELIALFEDAVADYRTWVYSHDPARVSG